MARKKPVGWRKEPVRHGLAAKGVKTAKGKAKTPRKKPRDITSGPFKRVNIVGTILKADTGRKRSKYRYVYGTPSGTGGAVRLYTEVDRINKRIVIRESKGMRQLARGIGRFYHMDGMSLEAAFTKPVFVRGSVADQLALAIHNYKKPIKGAARKTTYFEVFHVGSGSYYAYMHDDGSFVILKQTKAGNPPGRGS